MLSFSSLGNVVFVKLYAYVYIIIMFKMNYAKIEFLSIISLQRLGGSAPGPDLPLLFKLHGIWLVDSQENHKIAATRCQILRLKCIKFDFGWGSAPDPAEGTYSAPPDSLAGFKGPTSTGTEGKGRGRAYLSGRR